MKKAYIKEKIVVKKHWLCDKTKIVYTPVNILAKTLQQLKSKIQELVPEIMELKFGCQVKFDNHIWFFVESFPSHQHPCRHPYLFRELDGDGAMFVELKHHQKDSIKILGRPITLADVLLAVQEADVGSLYVTQDGRFMKDENGKVEVLDFYWQLDQPLDNQSEETINSLLKLLNG